MLKASQHSFPLPNSPRQGQYALSRARTSIPQTRGSLVPHEHLALRKPFVDGLEPGPEHAREAAGGIGCAAPRAQHVPVGLTAPRPQPVSRPGIQRWGKREEALAMLGPTTAWRPSPV